MVWLLVLLLVAAGEARTLHVPAQFTTIQSALDSVQNDDTVLVALGTYGESLQAPPRRFLLLGDVPTDTGDVPRPVIDPSALPLSDSLSCLHVPIGSAVRIQNLTFFNGMRMSASLRGGIQWDALTLEVRNCTFDSVSAGIHASFGNTGRVELHDCRFVNNMQWCVALSGGSLYAEHCLFDAFNTVFPLVSAQENSIFTRCVFRGGSSDPQLAIRSPNNAVVDQCLFTQAPSAAVQLSTYPEGHGSAQITNNVFDSVAVGYSVLILQMLCNQHLLVRGNIFRNIYQNAGHGMGDGIITYSCGPGGIGEGTGIFQDNFISGVRDGWLGSAEGIRMLASGTLSYNIFDRMASDTVPAMWCTDGHSALTENNLINTRLGLCKYLAGGDSLDARHNYWGDPSGPLDSVLNPQGRGAAILCNHDVLISPWLDSAYVPAAIGSSFIPHPSSFSLFCFPNPFNPQTELSFDLPQTGLVTLTVYDLLGRKVATLLDKYLEAGEHRIAWNGECYPSGMYFAVLRCGENHAVQKLLLMK